MPTTKPPVPEYNVPIVREDGTWTPIWWQWLSEFYRWYRVAAPGETLPLLRSARAAGTDRGLSQADTGFMAFNTTINKPYWWNGTAWVDGGTPDSGIGVTAVTGTAPIVSSGGIQPNISLAAASGSVDGYLKAADWTAFAGKEPPIAAGTTAQYWRGDKVWAALNKAAVGLGNVDNTSDVNKPVSTAQAAADALKVAKAGDTMTGLLTLSSNPVAGLHAVPKQYVDAPPDNKIYARRGSEWVAISGMASMLGEWTFNNTTTAPPASGQIRVNNANQQIATHLYVSTMTADSLDLSVLLRLTMTPGTKVYFQDKDEASRYVVYTVTACTAFAGYMDATVTFDEMGQPVPEQRCTLTVIVNPAAAQVQIADLLQRVTALETR